MNNTLHAKHKALKLTLAVTLLALALGAAYTAPGIDCLAQPFLQLTDARYKFGYGRQLPDPDGGPPAWRPVNPDGTFPPYVKAVNDALPADRKLLPEDFVLSDLEHNE